MGASPLRNRYVQAGLLALGGIVMFVGAATVLAQPDDGTDAAGMLGMSLAFVALAACLGAILVLFQAQVGKALGLQSRPAPAAPVGWYRVESRGGEWMWWDGRAWADPPPSKPWSSGFGSSSPTSSDCDGQDAHDQPGHEPHR